MSNKDASMLSDQEVFDKVVAHLRQQGKKSQKPTNSIGMCLYRGPGGLKCAVGGLIPDSEYKQKMDVGDEDGGGSDVAWLLTAYPHLKQYTGNNIPLLKALQKVHDATDVIGWENDLAEVAKQFRLVFTPISPGQPS